MTAKLCYLKSPGSIALLYTIKSKISNLMQKPVLSNKFYVDFCQPRKNMEAKISNVIQEIKIPARFDELGSLRWRRELSRKESGSVEVQTILQEDVSLLNVSQRDANDAGGFLGDHTADQLAINSREGPG